MAERLEPLWSQRSGAIVDADRQSVLLHTSGKVMAVDPATGKPQGASVKAARLPWPFLSGESVVHSRSAGIDVHPRRGGKATTVRAPTPDIDGKAPRPGYFSATPARVFDDFDGAHACRTWSRGDGVHWLMRWDRRGRAVSCVALDVRGKIVGLVALPKAAVVLSTTPSGGEEITIAKWDGDVVGRGRGRSGGTIDPLKWNDLALWEAPDDPERCVAVDTRSGQVVEWKLGGARLNVVGGELFSFHENAIARVDARGRTGARHDVIPQPGYPFAYFAARVAFRAGRLLGLPAAGRVFWVDAARLMPKGESRELPCDEVGSARVAGDIVVLNDRRTTYAFRLAALGPT